MTIDKEYRPVSNAIPMINSTHLLRQKLVPAIQSLESGEVIRLLYFNTYKKETQEKSIHISKDTIYYHTTEGTPVKIPTKGLSEPILYTSTELGELKIKGTYLIRADMSDFTHYTTVGGLFLIDEEITISRNSELLPISYAGNGLLNVLVFGTVPGQDTVTKLNIYNLCRKNKSQSRVTLFNEELNDLYDSVNYTVNRTKSGETYDNMAKQLSIFGEDMKNIVVVHTVTDKYGNMVDIATDDHLSPDEYLLDFSTVSQVSNVDLTSFGMLNDYKTWTIGGFNEGCLSAIYIIQEVALQTNSEIISLIGVTSKELEKLESDWPTDYTYYLLITESQFYDPSFGNLVADIIINGIDCILVILPNEYEGKDLMEIRFGSDGVGLSISDEAYLTLSDYTYGKLCNTDTIPADSITYEDLLEAYQNKKDKQAECE